MDCMTKEQRSRNMQHIRSKDTTPEKIVRSFLFKRGLRFRIADKRYPGHPDIVLPKYHAVVFVNGCFWHQHPGCPKAVMPKTNIDYWQKKLERNVERDQTNIQGLKALGWRTFVVWECELTTKRREETLENLYKEIINDF